MGGGPPSMDLVAEGLRLLPRSGSDCDDANFEADMAAIVREAGSFFQRDDLLSPAPAPAGGAPPSPREQPPEAGGGAEGRRRRRTATGDLPGEADLEQVLQALLLQEGWLEDRELALESLEGPGALPPTSTRGSAGLPLGDAARTSTRETLGPGLPATARTCYTPSSARTLREMRRTGPLGELSEGAQTTLLRGSLYAYVPDGSGDAASVTPEGGADPPRLSLGAVDHGRAGGGSVASAAPVSVRGVTRPTSTSNSFFRHDVDRDSLTLTSGTGVTLSDMLQGSLDRILQFTQRDEPPFWRDDSPQENLPTREATETAEVTWGADAVMDTARTTTSFATAGRSARTNSHPRAPSGGALSEEDEGVATIDGFDSPRSGGTSPPGTSREWEAVRPLNVGIGRFGSGVAADILDETASVWGFGDTMRSNLSTARSNRSESLSVQQSARTVGTALEQTLSLEGGLDGGFLSVLNRLAAESFALDESLSRSVRRVLQLGTVLTGQRLSDEEIQALPQVRFEASEQQSCTICLEAYHCGELLTSLSCGHFFHVDCLARWFQRSTQCPLCRANVD